MTRRRRKRQPKPAHIKHDKPTALAERYYIHIHLVTGECGWCYIVNMAPPFDSMEQLRAHVDARFAEAFEADRIESICAVARMTWKNAEVLAIKDNSSQLIPDELRRKFLQPEK